MPLRQISIFNKRTKKKVKKGLPAIKQLNDLASAINNLYDRLDTDSDFARDWRNACSRCNRRFLRTSFGESTFDQYHGFIRCVTRSFRHPDTGHIRRYRCCILYFWVDDFIVSFNFCYPRRRHIQ
ncbi:hypothetical protein PAAL109150_01705 [Paenibacillus alkaliterrae]